MTIRVAAVGDIHLGADTRGVLRPALEGVAECADVLLLAGDLTRCGSMSEARFVATEFADLSVPVVAVLGNHDHHSDEQDEMADLLREHGIAVLDGDSIELDLGFARLGVAGVKGFGGGFAGRCAAAFGERSMKEFVTETIDSADRLRAALAALDRPDVHARVALTHYAPVPDTLAGEPLEIYPFLGSYLLGEAIDEAGADLAIHGHAHYGTEVGATATGIPVRNVAQPLIRAAFARYELPIDVPDRVSAPA